MNEITTLGPNAVLVIVLNGIGLLFKTTPRVPNWLIPWLLIILGGTSYPFLISDVDGRSVLDVFKGVATALVAVGLHQTIKTTNENKPNPSS